MKAILLAAGNSCRFGKNKLLERVHGKLLYEHVLSIVQALEWEEIILVTQYEEIWNRETGKGITLIKNERPEEGIAFSISLGMKAAGPEADVMFFVCDQPYLKKETVIGMREMFLKHPEGIVCATSKERTGNPNIFSSVFYDELMSLKGDKGGKRVIKAHLELVRYYRVEERELKDMDYKEDLYDFLEKQ